MVSHEKTVGSVEGRQQLSRIDDREPPGGPGAEVVDSPPGANPLDREVHRDGKLRQDLQHRRSNP